MRRGGGGGRVWVFSALAAVNGAVAFPARSQATSTQVVSAQQAGAGVVLSGRISGSASSDYVVTAAAGQILSVDLLSRNGALAFNVIAEGAQEALFRGAEAGGVADVSLPADGRYIVQIYLMRSAARRGESAAYSLGVGVAGPDFADGLAGGPDWWAVAGLRQGGSVNIRTGPHRRYPVLRQVAAGAVLRNQGCRMTGPDRWCRVVWPGSDQQGWVIGRYLVEASPPAR